MELLNRLLKIISFARDFQNTLRTSPKGHKTADENIEMKKFEQAGNVFAEIWSKLIINCHPVVPQSVDEEPQAITVNKYQKWKANHVRES